MMKMKSTAPVKPQCFVGRIGVGQGDITPPLGIYSRCWGAASFDCATAIHREQKLTAIWIEAEEGQLLLVNLEIPWMDAKAWRLVLKTAASSAGLEGQRERVIINLTHNHSSAPIEEVNESLEGALLIQQYREQVLLVLSETINQAKQDCRPAQLTTDIGHCSLACNRDLKIEENGAIFCGFNPLKPADDTILVMRISDLDTNEIMATLVNYACHPTTLAWDNVHLSPDYAGAMRELVEAHTSAPCCLFQGASGDLSARHGHQGDTKVADKQGRQLGFAVLSCLEGMIEPGKQINFGGTVASGADLAYWTPGELDVEGSMQRLSAEIIKFELLLKSDLPSVKECQELYDTCQDRVMKERYRRKLRGRIAIGNDPQTQEKMWRWQVGNCVLFASSFEWYSDFQIQVREAFPDQHIAVLNLSNGGGSYLAPASLYDEVLYQKDISPYAAGCLEITIQAAKDSNLAKAPA